MSSQEVGIRMGTDPQTLGQQDQGRLSNCPTRFLEQIQSFIDYESLLISRTDVRMSALVTQIAVSFELACLLCSQWNTTYTRVLQVTNEGLSLDGRGPKIAYHSSHSSLSNPPLHILPRIQRHKLSFSCTCNWNLAFRTLILADLPFHFGMPV